MADIPFIVVNPMAANKRVGREWPHFERILKDAVGDFQFAFTTSSESAATLASDALREGFTTIVSLGGDGTHGTVINGFFGDSDQLINPDSRLAILPVGTGGDFRKTINREAKEFVEWAEILADGKAAPIDVGVTRFTDHQGNPGSRYFINIASFGMGGLVVLYVDSTTKRLGGKASFMLGTVRALMRYKAAQVRIFADDQEVFAGPVAAAAIANGQFFGGGMHFAPNAELSDGLFDVVVTPWKGRMNVITSSGHIYNGTHVDQPGVVTCRAKHVRAVAETDCLIEIDGEGLGRLPLEAEILPGAVQLVGLG